MRHKIIFSLFTLVCTNLQAQENNKRPIEFNDLYSGEFRSKVISSVNWYDTNSYVTRKEGAQGYGIYEVVFDTSGDEISSSDIFLGSNSFDNAKVSYKVYGEFVAYKKNYRKKWRYSGLYDYQITQIGSSQVLASINDVQYLTFNGAELSTGKAYFLFVQNNDLFVLNLKISEAGDKIEAATLPVTNHGEKEKIFNGIPDWVYEEEVIGTDHLAYFAPGKAGQQWIVYVRSDDTKVEHIQYQTYGQSENNREIDIYPKMEDIAYPKPDTENPLLKVYAVNLDRLFGLELDENGERWSMQMSQFLCNGNSNYPPYSDTAGVFNNLKTGPKTGTQIWNLTGPVFGFGL